MKTCLKKTRFIFPLPPPNGGRMPSLLFARSFLAILLSVFSFQVSVFSASSPVDPAALGQDDFLAFAFIPGPDSEIPRTFGSLSHLPFTSINNNTFSITFTPARDSLLYEVQVTTLLQSWQTVDVFFGKAVNPLPVTIASPLPVDITPRQHLRVKVFHSIDPAADTNGHGVPDWWRRVWFGTLDIDPLGDEDGDGLTNLAEYLAGTNPFVPTAKVAASAVGLVVYSPGK